MIEDMTLRKLTPKTQAGYLRAVLRFTRFFGHSPDLASARRSAHIPTALGRDKDVSPTTINATLTGLTFFFGVTLERPFGAEANEPGASHRRSYRESLASMK